MTSYLDPSALSSSLESDGETYAKEESMRKTGVFLCPSIPSALLRRDNLSSLIDFNNVCPFCLFHDRDPVPYCPSVPSSLHLDCPLTLDFQCRHGLDPSLMSPALSSPLIFAPPAAAASTVNAIAIRQRSACILRRILNFTTPGHVSNTVENIEISTNPFRLESETGGQSLSRRHVMAGAMSWWKLPVKLRITPTLFFLLLPPCLASFPVYRETERDSLVAVCVISDAREVPGLKVALSTILSSKVWLLSPLCDDFKIRADKKCSNLHVGVDRKCDS